MKETVRVILADDHSSVRHGLRSLLSAAPHVRVVGEAADTQALAELLDHYHCDVIISDVAMPGIGGESNAVSLLRRVLRESPHPQVVVLTMIHHTHTLLGLLHIGVGAIVDKRDAPDSLLGAIEAVVAGTLWLSGHARRALEAADPSSQPRLGVLSPREWEIFQMYAHGMTIDRIARTLDRSSKTISTQKRSAMRKLGLTSEVELADYARQTGLI
ncbi:response regulator transcription factor [Paraburkholderia gardini]|uniref:Transcriptional regulatory protein RcsB n=1 Tax=Paraburkholderia gardini TaxID=2823469 RepID=A0ABM8U4F7_9BURK|nr:response regulator transcription factor [Paraburkholderia gardini]CAG4901370.1 Transcriptional regulatory protein RcsB [Paraburkholderia gardini]